MKATENKIIFLSPLGYWTNAIAHVFNIKKDKISGKYNKIIEWTPEFQEFEKSEHPIELKAVNGEYIIDAGKLGVEDKPIDEYLYVFIAPITWASRFSHCGFNILGPAFGTNDSVRIFGKAGKEFEDIKYSKNKKDIIIGTIDKHITSTLLFRVYHLFMTKIFKTNIHLTGIRKRVKYSNTSFKLVSIPERSDRKERLEKDISDKESIDFAIFTFEDSELCLKDINEIREILRIDPILSHIFNLQFIPRTVYCTHKSQNHLKEQYKLFHDLLFQNQKRFKKPIEIPIVDVEESTYPIKATVFPINPCDEDSRKVIQELIECYKKILEIDKETNGDTDDISQKFSNLNKWTNLNDLKNIKL